MKKAKYIIFGIILGVLLTGSIGVIAYSINAKDITFTSTNDNFKAATVQEAMDELYNKSTKINVGSASCNATIDVKSKIPNYSDVTEQDFLYIVTDNVIAGEYSIKHHYKYAYFYKPVLSYDSSTGILTVSNNYVLYEGNNGGPTDYSSSKACTNISIYYAP